MKEIAKYPVIMDAKKQIEELHHGKYDFILGIAERSDEEKMASRKQKEFQIIEKAVLDVHKTLKGVPRKINSPSVSTRGYYLTKMPNGKLISAKDYKELILKLYHEYGGKTLIKVLTFKDVFDRAMEKYKEDNPTERSEKTIRNYHCDCRRFVSDELADTPINDIDKDYLIRYLRNLMMSEKKNNQKHNATSKHSGHRLENGMSRKALLNCKTLFNLVFDYAVSNELIKSNPAKEIRNKDLYKYTFNSLGNRRPSDVNLSNTEMTNLLNEIKRRSELPSNKNYYPYLPMALLQLNTGMRPGELCALKWTDIVIYDNMVCLNIHAQIIEIDNYENIYVPDTKNEKGDSSGGRNLPLSQSIKHILTIARDYQKNNEVISDYIFSSKNGDFKRPRDYEKYINSVMKSVGIYDPSKYNHKGTYVFRREFNNRLERGGSVTSERANLMGHSPTVNLLNYTNGAADYLKHALDIFDKYFDNDLYLSDSNNNAANNIAGNTSEIDEFINELLKKN